MRQRSWTAYGHLPPPAPFLLSVGVKVIAADPVMRADFGAAEP